MVFLLSYSSPLSSLLSLMGSDVHESLTDVTTRNEATMHGSDETSFNIAVHQRHHYHEASCIFPALRDARVITMNFPHYAIGWSGSGLGVGGLGHRGWGGGVSSCHILGQQG